MESHEEGVGGDSEMEEAGREGELDVAESEDRSLGGGGGGGRGVGGDVAGFELGERGGIEAEGKGEEGGMNVRVGELRPLPFPSFLSSLSFPLLHPFEITHRFNPSTSRHTVLVFIFIIRVDSLLEPFVPDVLVSIRRGGGRDATEPRWLGRRRAGVLDD